jgi:hypothetical protein
MPPLSNFMNIRPVGAALIQAARHDGANWALLAIYSNAVKISVFS